MKLRVVVAILGAAACQKDPPPPTASGSAARVTATPIPDPCAQAQAEGPLAWIRDDYPAAIACARARHVPIVVDLWAPWCHTCLSMQSTVFLDPSFAPDAKRFVFAALDTEREGNAAIIEELSLSAWPTFYVVAPPPPDAPPHAVGSVLARFVGAASAPQFHAFLDTGATAAGAAPTGPDAALLAAERALAVKDLAAAETQLAAALAAAPADWPRRTEALVSLIATKQRRKDSAACVDLAERELGATGNTAAASDFLVTATTCADDLVAGSDKLLQPAAKARAAALREQAVTRWQALLADPTSPMSVDDRSDAMASLRETLDKLGRHTDAVAVAEQQRALLDKTAAAAPSPAAAMTYHWPRAEVYVYLGKALELVPALEASAAALPKEYEPPARLGWLYLKAGHFALAARWTDQALALVYGPRKARLLSQRADIAHGLKDAAAERELREQAVAVLAGLPEGQRNEDQLAHAREALAALPPK